MSEPWATDTTDIKVNTSPFPLWWRHTGWQSAAVPHPGYDCSMLRSERYPQEAWIHVFIHGSATNAGRNTCPLPRTESHSKHGCWKALFQLPCRNRCPHAGCLHSSGFRSWLQLQAGCLPLWSPLHPAGISNPQAPKHSQSPTARCMYQEGCSTVDSSLLWNIRKWASGYPCKGRCKKRTAQQQCQLQWKEECSRCRCLEWKEECSLSCRHIKFTRFQTWPKPYSKLHFTRRAVPQWIPAYCGTSGNEQADILAKEGAEGEQHNNVSFSEKKTHQSAQDAKLTEVWLSPAVLGAASRSGEALYQDIIDWTVKILTCTANWSWHPHKPASVVKKTKPQSMFYKEASFTKLREKMCGLSALPWWQNSTAASRSWRRQLNLLSGPDQLQVACNAKKKRSKWIRAQLKLELI